ncbi:MAG TPA: alkaline phosphatase D family protein [Bryobacteraceae bacterium]|nr:alkaline phosphatase D family protein [Bryobacteraceae bacterium]
MSNLISRRRAIGAVLSPAVLRAAPAPETRQATGVKAGEITPQSAVIWTRRTKASSRLVDGIVRKGHAPKASPPKPGEDVNGFEGACPGGEGSIRVHVELAAGRGRRRTMGWVDVQSENDFAHQFRLQGLTPATEYRFAIETRSAASKRAEEMLTGSFRTAPRETDAAAVHFALSSCQIYYLMDRPDGFAIYEAIEKRRPAFLLSCGDNVYYDSEDPVVNSPAVARYHWQRMYSLPKLHSCLRTVPGYWLKDDHDLYTDDGWPGVENPKMLPFRFEQGVRIFREQVPSPPMDQPFYRRFRWGADLEIFLPESREYRSPNTAADGPGKTIWGEAQRMWLQNALASSTARWKFLINPNPIVGPDHARKNDNHANPAFATEGREFRRWLKANVEGSVILMNGDRHWQYHSVDPEYGVEEFGCGPASDAHAVAPSRGEDPRYHRFLRVKGGFVDVSVNPDDREQSLVIAHCDVSGNVVNRRVLRRRA